MIARLGLVKDQIVHAVVAMDDRRRALGAGCAAAATRSAGPSPRSARSRRRGTAGSSARSGGPCSCRAVRNRRARPRRNRPCASAAMTAFIEFEHRAALGRAGDLRQALVPEDAPVEKFHDIKGAADHRIVLAQRMDARHRHVRPGERPHDAELAIDGMGARQQRPGRLAPQHVLARTQRRADSSGSTARRRSARPPPARETPRHGRAATLRAGRAGGRWSAAVSVIARRPTGDEAISLSRHEIASRSLSSGWPKARPVGSQ